MSLINFINRVNIDFGAIRHLAIECEQLKIQRPMLVTDPGIRATGILDRVLGFTEGLTVTVFDRTPSNPTEAAVTEGAALFNSARCDGLIALGGGSSIDCAKGIAIAATHEAPLSQYAIVEGGTARITAKSVPIIAIPTTSGTGSEVARAAVLILNDGRKLTFRSEYLLPKVAICDPELTLGLPAGLTAATGMDAIAHCIETFMSSAFNPPADGIALDGLRRAWTNIELATTNGQDREARMNMMCAAMQGALAFPKGVGCVHSLSHSLGGIDHRMHHGTLNAVLLPSVIRFNSEDKVVIKEDKLARLANAMGLKTGTDVVPALLDMNTRLGLPSGLVSMGFETVNMDRAISGALKDACHATNPREASAENYHEMITEAL
ncbi:iron-containing alcohol dehydrogenase [Paraburkholderia sediminicola]|jgi:hypothetical protein|uniref:iron-containing alcohol dehydrogenase n=1 Tax=Paraburkholderia sediminicola TaxID=458836 RepID=UPI0038B893F5